MTATDSCASDVAILYHIIRSAEQSPNVETQPFRAIFAAYDDILLQNGLDPDHDQVYLRFLFRLGDGRDEGQSLYESFERLLEELGIQIEFNSEEEGIQEVTRNLSADGYDLDEQSQQFAGTRSRSRRASFNSIHDAEDESTRAIRSRAGSRSSMSRLEIRPTAVQDKRPSTRATTRATEKTTISASIPNRPAVQTGRGRLTAEDFASNLQHYQRRHASVPTRREHEYNDIGISNAVRTPIEARAASTTGDVSLASGDFTEDAIQVQVTNDQSHPRFVVGQQERFYTPSRTQLLRDADTFQHYRIRTVAREVVEKWCYAALEARNHHEHMERTATAHDTEILVRQAFEHWRLRLHAKKQSAETERYFNHLERRATKARNLYLLTKAFTHWAQCAEDEVLRTSLARQHVLSIKYFHAWRDITATNQGKIHLQGLRKLFGIWKQRFVRNLTDDIKADLLYQNTLTKSGYWLWFWAFCERRAPVWRARRLKHRHLLQWLAFFRYNRQRRTQTILNSENAAKKSYVSQWLDKARVILSSQREAALFHEQRSVANALQAWTLGRRHAPLAQQVSNMVDWRVAGTTFAIFVNKHEVEKQAAKVNRMRILRVAWTQWNDQLRIQALTHRTDDRYLLEALYKWVIAERSILLRRLQEQRLKQACLHKLRQQCLKLRVQRHNIRQNIEGKLRQRLLHSVVSRWRLGLEAQHRAGQIAFEFHAPQVVQDILQRWTQSSNHYRKMDSWATDAVFYFIAKRYLHRWHIASIESSRQKRRNAYVQVRRRAKMSLASGVLQRWRNHTAQIRELQRNANEHNDERLLRVGTSLFEHWRSVYHLCSDQHFQAGDHYETRLLEHHLHTWFERLSSRVELEKTASLNAELRVQNMAFSQLNRLRLRIIELKGPQATAGTLRARYEKRHFHNILRLWQDKTASRLSGPRPKTSSSKPRKMRPLHHDEYQLSSTGVAETGAEFDQSAWIPSLEASSSMSPIPGYLSTPSKRAARAKALVQESTTPAGTPFQNRLRSQLNATPRTARRGAFGRSSALRGSTFGSIMEDSVRTSGPERDE